MNMRPVYIYALCDPDQPWNIRYVGKTAKNLTKRLYEHCTIRNLKAHTHKNKWISSLIRVDKRPLIRLIDIGDVSSWESLEKFYILSYRKAGFDLTNTTDGGEGVFGREDSLETRFKKSSRMLGNTYGKANAGQTHNLGKKRSSIARKNMSDSQMGNQHWLGKKHKPETIEKIRTKAIERQSSLEFRQRMSEAVKKGKAKTEV